MGDEKRSARWLLRWDDMRVTGPVISLSLLFFHPSFALPILPASLHTLCSESVIFSIILFPLPQTTSLSRRRRRLPKIIELLCSSLFSPSRQYSSFVFFSSISLCGPSTKFQRPVIKWVWVVLSFVYSNGARASQNGRNKQQQPRKIKQQAEAAYQFDGCYVSHGYSVRSAYIIIELYYLVDNRGSEMERERENVEMKI